MKNHGNFQGEGNSQILRDWENAFQLLEWIRSNLSQIFLQAGNARKLHERYIKQRQERAWNFARQVDEILIKYPSSNQLTIIYSTILRNIQIAAWTKSDTINESSILSLAQTMATHPIDKEKPNISVIMTLLEKMWVTRSWVERFLSGSLDREILQRMQ